MSSQALTRIGRANLVTGLRALLIAGLILGPWHGWPFVVGGVLALALDGVDGWVARRWNEASPFGARFDMEVDAGFMLGLSILIVVEDRAGPWILVAGLLRYFWIGACAYVAWLRRPLKPSRLRQSACVAALVLLLAALSPPASGLPATLAALGAVSVLLWSFGRDLGRLWRVRGMDLRRGSHYLSLDNSTSRAQEGP